MAKINGIEGKGVGNMIAGNMYFYKYIAEDDNEFYDMFPLVFILKRRASLYEGINLHYLDITRRKELLDLLLQFMDTNVIETKTRLRVKVLRKILLVSRKYKQAKVSFHRYQKRNIRSTIIKVDPNNWSSIILEPVELFKIPKKGKMPSAKVWRKTLIDSRKR